MDKSERIRLAAEVFQEYGPLILLLIRRHIHDENDVDDMYQNVFLSLVAAPPSSRASLPAYFSAVVKNQIRDAVRRATSYGSCIERYAKLQTDNAVHYGPETRLIHEECMQRLILLVKSILPSHMADVMVQRYVYNRDIAEIAARLGISKRTVSRYCCVASERIRRLVDEGQVSLNVAS